MLRGKWLIVQRDQLDAVAETIDKTGINSTQAIAIVMILVGARIGERRMRDLIETMSQMTEVPTRGRQTSKRGRDISDEADKDVCDISPDGYLDSRVIRKLDAGEERLPLFLPFRGQFLRDVEKLAVEFLIVKREQIR